MRKKRDENKARSLHPAEQVLATFRKVEAHREAGEFNLADATAGSNTFGITYRRGMINSLLLINHSLMVGDRYEHRGSNGTLGEKWTGADGERMGRRGRKNIVALAPAERRAGLRFCIRNHEGCGADGRQKRNELAN